MEEISLDVIRKHGLLAGEKRYMAVEAMKTIIDWFTNTKPSTLLTFEEKGSKESRAVVEEPKMRELWQKWGDSVTKCVYEKGAQIPELLVDDVINIFKEKAGDVNAKSS